MSCTHTAVSGLQLSHTHNARFLHNNCSHRVVLQLYSTVVIDRVTIWLGVVNKPRSYERCKTLWVLTLLLQHTAQTATPTRITQCHEGPANVKLDDTINDTVEEKEAGIQLTPRRVSFAGCGTALNWIEAAPGDRRRCWIVSVEESRTQFGHRQRQRRDDSTLPPSLYISIHTPLGCPDSSGW